MRLSLLIEVTSIVSLLPQTTPLSHASHRRPMRRPSLQMTATYVVDATDVGGPLAPLSDYMLIKCDPDITETGGGIMIADRAKEPASTGTVLEVGPGRSHPERAAARIVGSGSRSEGRVAAPPRMPRG